MSAGRLRYPMAQQKTSKRSQPQRTGSSGCRGGTLMLYDETIASQLEESARELFDLLVHRYGKVELFSPEETIEKDRWFVQIWLKKQHEFPVGAFGKTPLLAAQRLMKLAKTWGEDN